MRAAVTIRNIQRSGMEAMVETTNGTGVADPATGRERVLRAAYDLFSRDGVRSVGVDMVIAEAGVAKMTLYRNFPSKEELVLAFLQRREETWTHGWVRQEIERRAETPTGRLLAVFDLFGEWFQRSDFEGCAFISILLEMSEPDSAIRRACVNHLANIRMILHGIAVDAGAPDPDNLARQWHILMKGSIVAAGEGDMHAASRAQLMGELLLRHYGLLD